MNSDKLRAIGWLLINGKAGSQEASQGGADAIISSLHEDARTRVFDSDMGRHILTSHVWRSSGQISFIAFAREYEKQKSSGIFEVIKTMKISFGLKKAGRYSSAKDMRGREIPQESLYGIWRVLVGLEQDCLVELPGVNQTSSSISFNRVAGGVVISCEYDGDMISTTLEAHEVAAVQAIILGVMQIQFPWLSDEGIITILGRMTPYAGAAAVTVSDGPGNTVAAVDNHPPAQGEPQMASLERVRSIPMLRVWISEQLPGLGVSEKTKKVLWAIGMQKLNGDDDAMEVIKMLQSCGSDLFCKMLADSINSEDRAMINLMVEKYKDAATGN